MREVRRVAWPPIISVAIAVTATVGAVGLLLVTGEPQTVARRDLALVGGAVEGVDITVRCGLTTTSGDDRWGAAAGVVCARPALRRLSAAGAVAVLGGFVGLLLASEPLARRRGELGSSRAAAHRRVAQLVDTLVVVAGLSALALGLGLTMLADEVAELTTDEATALAAVAPTGEVVASFEVIGLSATGGGRYEEELWVVVATSADGGEGVGSVRQALAGAEWATGEVPEEFDDGWVAFRGAAGAAPDLVEIGLVRDVLDDDANLTTNARQLIRAAVPDDRPAVAVRLAPSRLAG